MYLYTYEYVKKTLKYALKLIISLKLHVKQKCCTVENISLWKN